MNNKESIKTKDRLTVVLTRYGESDKLVEECLQSLAAQRKCRVTVLFLDQMESEYLRQLCLNISSSDCKFEYKIIPAKSLSYARNTGVELAKTNFVAFCDPDCVLSQNWAFEIANTLSSTGSSIVGTKIIPRWNGRMRWFHHAKILHDFFSLLDLADERISFNKVIGGSFGMNKTLVGMEAYFDENLGLRDGNIYHGGEETDLCQRVMARNGKIMYTPFTYAEHQIPEIRMKTKIIFIRAYFAGHGRAVGGGKIQPFNKRRREFLDYLAILYIAPAYFTGYAKGMIDRKLHVTK